MYPPLLMPGAFRLRALHPLLEPDGVCALIYDLERAAVFEVPSDLQLYIGSVLDRGDLDGAVFSWLVREDLLTSENQDSWPERASAEAGLHELEDPGWKGALLRGPERLEARIENVERYDLASILRLLFRQSYGARSIVLSFDWARSFPGSTVLAWVVREAKSLADRERIELTCEVSLAVGEITPRLVDTLADLPLQVRLVSCGDDGLLGGVRRPLLEGLIERLGERLTLEVASRGPRLREIWHWAQRSGLRRLDLVPLAATAGGPSDPLRAYRRELAAICEDTLEALAEGRMPCDFLPLTRLVGRLRRSEPLNGEALLPGWTMGEGATWDDGEAEAASGATACASCWARRVCGHSPFVDSPLAERRGLGPASGGCAGWRLEGEAALRFYHQLAQTDPIQALRFFEELPAGPAPLNVAAAGMEEPQFSPVPF